MLDMIGRIIDNMICTTICTVEIGCPLNLSIAVTLNRSDLNGQVTGRI